MDGSNRPLERLADIPWGLILFLFIVVAGAVGVWIDRSLPLSDYVSAVAIGTGLHGIGHGIRSHGRSRQQVPATS